MGWRRTTTVRYHIITVIGICYLSSEHCDYDKWSEGLNVYLSEADLFFSKLLLLMFKLIFYKKDSNL